MIDRSMYCVDCGKEKDIFRNGSCLSCYLKHNQFAKGPEIFHIPICNYCNAYKYKNTWKEESFKHIVKRFIKNGFSFNQNLKNISIDLEYQDEEDSIFCKVIIKGQVDDTSISEDHYVEIRLQPNVCDICSKRFGGYHEAIIQIRPGQRKLIKKRKNEIQIFVEKTIEKMKDQGNRKLFLSDMGREHGGLDFFISDKQAAYAIIKKVQEAYGGSIQVSSSNIGMKDGKQLYRYTYLLRLLPFDKEDVFKFQGDYYIVKTIDGYKLHIIQLQDWSESLVKGKEIEQAIFIGSAKELSFQPILVNETENEFQLMHPKSYAVFTVKKPKETISFTENIMIIHINESFFIKPVIK